MPALPKEQPVFYKPVQLPQLLSGMQQELAHAKGAAARITAAIKIIDEYISFFGGDGMRSDMQQLLSAAIGKPGAQLLSQEAAQQDLVFFYEFTLLYFDAVYVVHGKERFGRME